MDGWNLKTGNRMNKENYEYLKTLYLFMNLIIYLKRQRRERDRERERDRQTDRQTDKQLSSLPTLLAVSRYLRPHN